MGCRTKALLSLVVLVATALLKWQERQDTKRDQDAADAEWDALVFRVDRLERRDFAA